MQITAIIGTGVKGGTVDKICQSVLKGAQESGHSTDSIYLSDYQIAPCMGCFKCLGDKNCCVNDGFNEVYEKCVQSNVLVLGSPIYFGNVSGLMKNFIDRHNGNAMINPPEMAGLRDMAKKERMNLFFKKLSKEYKPKQEIQGKKVICVLAGNKPAFLLRLTGELKTAKKAVSYYGKELNNDFNSTVLYGGALLYPEKEEKVLKKAFLLGKTLM